jgi:uncharacterized phage-associated protein
MVYIAQGINLAINDAKLYAEDTRAWNFGPVVPELYKKLQKYGNGTVKEKINSVSSVLDDKDKKLVEFMYNNYKQYSGWQLSELTHQPNTPWSKTWEYNKYGVIPADDICEHYKNFLN